MAFLYEDDLALRGESEVDLIVILRHFIKVKRKDLKVNPEKSKMMV